MTGHCTGRPGSKHVAVVDRVAAGQRRVDHGHCLVANIGSTWCVAEIDVAVEQFAQTVMLSECRGQDQSGVSDLMLVIEGHRDVVQSV